jgi:hypothetical protein
MKCTLVAPDSKTESGHQSHVGSHAKATKMTISLDLFVLLIGNTPREALLAVAQYDILVVVDYAKKLPPEDLGIRRLEVDYATFNGRISSEEAIKAIAAVDTHLPYVIAGFDETAAFGASYPEEQKKHLVVGPKLVPTDDTHYGITVLSAYGKKRRISIIPPHVQWPANTRFLILRPL